MLTLHFTLRKVDICVFCEQLIYGRPHKGLYFSFQNESHPTLNSKNMAGVASALPELCFGFIKTKR